MKFTNVKEHVILLPHIVAPIITVSRESINAVRQKTVIIPCEVKGSPKPDVSLQNEMTTTTFVKL